MIPTLETRRLLLRPLELADAGQATDFSSLGSRPIPQQPRSLAYPSDGVQTYYRGVALPAIERGEEWHWSLRLKSAPSQMIGCITLMNREGNNRGFWLGTTWHGQGLMSEACEVVTDFWFDVLKFSVLRVPKAAANLASRRISEKTGMRLVDITERDYVSGRLPTEVWEISRDEWAARRNSRVPTSE